VARNQRIGAAAAALGTEAHVLRHWEDTGLLQPPRSSSGHRSYDEEQLTRARLILPVAVER
jgi:DNA-binding transcriptional MerR regulator